MAQGRGHAAAEFAERDGDANVTGAHKNKAPDDVDRTAIGQAHGEILSKGRPCGKHTEGER